MTAPLDPRALTAQVFDHQRQDFFGSVDRLIASAALSPEDKAVEIIATINVLRDKLRLMWGT